jgi:hypothetical protein
MPLRLVPFRPVDAVSATLVVANKRENKKSFNIIYYTNKKALLSFFNNYKFIKK